MSISLSDVLLFSDPRRGGLRRGKKPLVAAYIHHRLVSPLTVTGFINFVNSAAVVFTFYAVTASPEAFAVYHAQAIVIIQNAVHRRGLPRGLEKATSGPVLTCLKFPGLGASCVPADRPAPARGW
jgi:hypothetical protein